MDIAEIYFAFHRRATLREVFLGGQWTTAFGHVEAFGYTIDQTWFFYDPRSWRTDLKITHMYDEVNNLLTDKFTTAQEVIRYTGEPLRFSTPFHGPMNCVTQCAGLIGVRAFTPKSFRKILLANNAEVVRNEIRP